MLARRTGGTIGFGAAAAASERGGTSGAPAGCGRDAWRTFGGDPSGALTVPRANEFANETSRFPVEVSEEEGNSDTANLIESPTPVSGMERRESGNEFREPTAHRPGISLNAESRILPTEIPEDSSRSSVFSAE